MTENFFETRVIETITPALNVGERAEFFANTLFVEGSHVTLAKVILALDKIGAGKIKVSDVHGEFAIDFI